MLSIMFLCHTYDLSPPLSHSYGLICPLFRLYDAACLTYHYPYPAGGVLLLSALGVPSGLLGMYEELAPLAHPCPSPPPPPLLLGARAAPRLLGMYEGPLVLPSSSPLARPAAVYCVHASGCREVDVPFTSVLACMCAEFPHARTLSLLDASIA